MFKRIRNGKTQYIYGKKWILNDIGRRDSQGNIVIVGRNDNIVNIAGEKISLREIEEKIYEIPNVREVKVKAEMDKNNNTYISAYISLYDRSAEINIRKELMGKLPLSKIPKKVEIRDALSRTSTGKIKENQWMFLRRISHKNDLCIGNNVYFESTWCLHLLYLDYIFIWDLSDRIYLENNEG